MRVTLILIFIKSSDDLKFCIYFTFSFTFFVKKIKEEPRVSSAQDCGMEAAAPPFSMLICVVTSQDSLLWILCSRKDEI